jgi:hypothetical protein
MPGGAGFLRFMSGAGLSIEPGYNQHVAPAIFPLMMSNRIPAYSFLGLTGLSLVALVWAVVLLVAR